MIQAVKAWWSSTAHGAKDESVDPFEFLNDVFRRRTLPDGGVTKKSSLLDSTTTEGTILIEGFFDNYPKVKSTDPSMTTISKSSEWISFADFAHRLSQGFGLQKHRYSSVTAVCSTTSTTSPL